MLKMCMIVCMLVVSVGSVLYMPFEVIVNIRISLFIWSNILLEKKVLNLRLISA